VHAVRIGNGDEAHDSSDGESSSDYSDDDSSDE
jgi:hypothetical protein